MTHALKRPSNEKARAVAARLAGESPKRLVVDLPASMHRNLRVRAGEKGTSIRELVIEALKAKGL